MNRSQGLFKRKRADANSSSQALTEHEKILLEMIRSKTDMGIWTGDLKREAKLPENVVTKSLKSLQAKKLIKEVATVQNRSKKHLMAVEFEPSKEITGGAWYVDGNLDVDFITHFKQFCLYSIKKMKVATLTMIADAIKKSGAFTNDYTTEQVAEIVEALILDNDVKKVTSYGLHEFESIPVGETCYTCARKGGSEPKVGAMASIPCGVCPVIQKCTPDGVISPKTCVYYTKWLDF